MIKGRSGAGEDSALADRTLGRADGVGGFAAGGQDDMCRCAWPFLVIRRVQEMEQHLVEAIEIAEMRIDGQCRAAGAPDSGSPTPSDSDSVQERLFGLRSRARSRERGEGSDCAGEGGAGTAGPSKVTHQPAAWFSRRSCASFSAVSFPRSDAVCMAHWVPLKLSVEVAAGTHHSTSQSHHVRRAFAPQEEAERAQAALESLVASLREQVGEELLCLGPPWGPQQRPKHPPCGQAPRSVLRHWGSHQCCLRDLHSRPEPCCAGHLQGQLAAAEAQSAHSVAAVESQLQTATEELRAAREAEQRAAERAMHLEAETETLRRAESYAFRIALRCAVSMLVG